MGSEKEPVVKDQETTPKEKTEKKSGVSTRTVVIIAVVVLLVVIAVAAVVIVKLLNRPTVMVEPTAKVMLDQDSLQAAMDEAMENAAKGNVALHYVNEAFSDDGIHFTCTIMNSPSNIYDMFLTIYSDPEMTDEIFLSGLVKPGNGFEELTLSHALPTGDNVVYVALTQVEEDENGEQAIVQQVIHTMDFIVS